MAPHQGAKAFLNAWFKDTTTPPMPHHDDWKATSVSEQDAPKREADLARDKELKELLSSGGPP
ncbi:hypothetical protein SSP24_80100 [Streptomyces spinoverrucosus]|uniref:Uncharacterized protein n=1 Tax=Streptomyces spinoverrucosus TaxID=284043 RepID=A0A4Y3VW40_9ACTN|nr:hypothetical protein [Streptomyces spinoverrucosus]GEC10355.1 hypothetical protein SSP24_80100 [Streptomyces spinoverrucosus]GHB98530.1 hypothetical protein GCM10010397_83740 [Streptomyces spinoverrucosus]